MVATLPHFLAFSFSSWFERQLPRCKWHSFHLRGIQVFPLSRDAAADDDDDGDSVFICSAQPHQSSEPLHSPMTVKPITGRKVTQSFITLFKKWEKEMTEETERPPKDKKMNASIFH